MTKFKKNIMSNLFLQVLSMILGFFTSIMIARGLGVENQGEFSYYLLIFGIISSYGSIGISNATGYFIKKTKHDRDVVINNNITFLLFFSIIYCILVFVFNKWIFSNSAKTLYFVWMLYTLNLLFEGFLVTIYNSDETIYVYNKFFILANIIKALAIFFLYCTSFFNITSLSILYSVVEIIKLLLLRKGLNFKYKFKFDIKLLIEEFKYGIPLFLASLFIYLNYRADQLMVKNFLGNTELGIYSIGVHLAELAFIFPTSISSAFEGKLYSYEKKDKKNITSLTIRFTFLITLMIGIIGVFCKPLISVLYGEEYKAAGFPMCILLFGIIFFSIGKVAPAYFYTQGNSKIHLKVSSIVLLINCVLNLIFIPKFGINGAAVASTIAYFFYGIIYLIMLKKSGFKILNLLLPQKDDFNKLKEIFFNNKKKV